MRWGVDRLLTSYALPQRLRWPYGDGDGVDDHLLLLDGVAKESSVPSLLVFADKFRCENPGGENLSSALSNRLFL